MTINSYHSNLLSPKPQPLFSGTIGLKLHTPHHQSMYNRAWDTTLQSRKKLSEKSDIKVSRTFRNPEGSSLIDKSMIILSFPNGSQDEKNIIQMLIKHTKKIRTHPLKYSFKLKNNNLFYSQLTGNTNENRAEKLTLCWLPSLHSNEYTNKIKQLFKNLFSDNEALQHESLNGIQNIHTLKTDPPNSRKKTPDQLARETLKAINLIKSKGGNPLS